VGGDRRVDIDRERGLVVNVNWAKLAEELGAGSGYSTEIGYRAIVSILGEEFFENAVEHTIDLKDGWCLSEGVLRILAPLGMKHCYHLYKTSPDIEVRRSATYFMKYLGDRGVLDYLPEFLVDPDEVIQNNVIEIIDQMYFLSKLDDEELMPILESALNHPNKKIREFAGGSIHKETLQGAATFAEDFEAALGAELWQWKKRLSHETIHAFDLQLLPWAGTIKLSFLTDQEKFISSDAYSEDCYGKWRWSDVPYHSDQLPCLGGLMQKEYEKSRRSLKSIELFLEAAVTAINSSRIQKILRKYQRSKDFQITVFNVFTDRPWKNFYSIR
jgi:hypothetical protein